MSGPAHIFDSWPPPAPVPPPPATAAPSAAGAPRSGSGRCPECQGWGTVQEAEPAAGRVQAATVPASRQAQPHRPRSPLTRSPAAAPVRASSTACSAAAIVPGSVILLSGEPGVGKSTLLLAVASHVAAMGARVLYVSAEESLGQVRMRAERTGGLSPNLWLSAETDLAVVLGQIEQVEPQLVIVDSVQTVSTADATGIAGGPGQVREVAASLTRVAKERNLPVLLVGHVTKDGQIAGPRVLEHLVDVVCHFEGDRRHRAAVRARGEEPLRADGRGRLLRDDGRGHRRRPRPERAVPLPLHRHRAGHLRHARARGPPGASRWRCRRSWSRRAAPEPAARRERRGQRPGRDAARRARSGTAASRLGQSDVYVSTVGGVRLTEPAVDLAIALALASRDHERPIRRTSRSAARSASPARSGP